MEGIMKKRVLSYVLLSLSLILVGGFASHGWSETAYSVTVVPMSAEEMRGDSESSAIDVGPAEMGVVHEKDQVEKSPGLKAVAKGTLYVRNRSYYDVDVYIDGRWIYQCLPSGYKLTVRKVSQKWHSFYAECCFDGCTWWGPFDYRQKKQTTITLYDW